MKRLSHRRPILQNPSLKSNCRSESGVARFRLTTLAGLRGGILGQSNEEQ
jgi:hypothetical protein